MTLCRGERFSGLEQQSIDSCVTMCGIIILSAHFQGHCLPCVTKAHNESSFCSTDLLCDASMGRGTSDCTRCSTVCDLQDNLVTDQCVSNASDACPIAIKGESLDAIICLWKRELPHRSEWKSESSRLWISAFAHEGDEHPIVCETTPYSQGLRPSNY